MIRFIKNYADITFAIVGDFIIPTVYPDGIAAPIKAAVALKTSTTVILSLNKDSCNFNHY